MSRKSNEFVKKYINKEVLLGILKTGILFGVAVTAPGVLKVFKKFDKSEPWYEYYPSSVERMVNKLYRQGIVEIKDIKGKSVVSITKKGRVEVLKYDLGQLTISKPQKWDGKWRLVIFDISNKNKKSLKAA